MHIPLACTSRNLHYSIRDEQIPMTDRRVESRGRNAKRTSRDRGQRDSPDRLGCMCAAVRRSYVRYPPEMLIYTWYIRHQTASFQDVADGFGVTVSTLYRIITKMTIFISNLSPQINHWPNDNEKREIEEYFRRKGFACVIGAIDGCHVRIDKPNEDAESHINRKGYYSIQMQVVCDHNRKIRDVFVGNPGSVHDARVFRNSPIGNTLEEKCGQYFLLGDSAYPLKRNLMTPFKDRGQLTPRQINYNIRLYESNTVHLIRAACVLHNIAIDDTLLDNEYNEMLVSQLPEHNEEDEDLENDMIARGFRENIVQTL
ncbi:hypothetical protein MML48_1g05040 [Holotrichia oblita]|uniref:Uncharacterized protein n=1 Tax=Holotrichia oblita TaxID=644536 RepID=A0ACB9TWN6_HOLOL|nr:hypothetical protein MML48_1g05040 [Holotrichia oblita]